MKKALFFDPYLDTLGGGERYVLTFALSLAALGFEVDLAWRNQKDLDEAENRFGLDLSGVKINPHAYDTCSNRSSLIDRFEFTNKYDLIFWVSDGSLPFLFGKNNLVHFQVPFTSIGGNPIINRLKLSFINKLVFNSQFTRMVINKSLPDSKDFVLYPPIDTDQFIGGKKENIILSVARLTSPSHSKRQDVLIDTFNDLSSRIKGYRLILAGGHKGDSQILDDLKNRAKGLSVDIIPNPTFNELKQLYSKAKYFWHAAGFQIDEAKEPEKVEHFGMTTVEAMSAGCVPIVIAKGGQKEIVTKESGLLVDSISELAQQTEKLIKDPKLTESLSQSAIKRSRLYSIASFKENINSLI